MDAADPEIVEEFDEDERDEIFPTKESGERAIDRLREIAEPSGVELQGIVKKGNFQKVILREILNYDALAMHEISRSNLRDFLPAQRSSDGTARSSTSGSTGMMSSRTTTRSGGS